MREREPGVWDLQASAGKDPVTGRRRRLTRRVTGTKRDAERALTALVHEADTGAHGGTLASVATVLERWWEIHADRLSPTTAARYRQIIDQYLLPRWGDQRISTIDVSEISAWFQALQREPSSKHKEAKPLAPATVRQIRAVFRRALKAAVQWGWLDTNPIDRTDGIAVPRRRLEAITPAAVLKLLEAAAAKDPDLLVWATVAATTGMRRSEMAGLRWRDVDLAAGVVKVNQAVVQTGRQLHVKGTKTDRYRDLRLDGDTIAVLTEQRARAERHAEQAMVDLVDDALVWSSAPDGARPVSPDGMTQAWRRLCRSQKVTGIRLHDLRHFMATQTILAGMNVAKVSERLGHSTITTTLNIYTDHVKADDQDIADFMGSILRPEEAEGDDEAA